MNRLSFSIIACLMALTNTISAADNLTISDFLVIPGMTDKELNIELNNDQTYAAFQFDLYLPEGITITGFSAGNRLPAKTDLQMQQQTDGSYRFITIPPDLKSNISGTSGSILTIIVSVDENVALGTLTGYFRNIKLSDTNGEGNTYAEMSFPVTALKLGDVNGDGTVDIADAVCIAYHIVGKATPTFYEIVADVNDDGTVDITDAVRIINFVVGKIKSLDM